MTGEWTKHDIYELRPRARPEQLHRIVPELCQPKPVNLHVQKLSLPVLHQPFQFPDSESPFERGDASGVFRVSGDPLGRMWLLRAD